MLGIDPGSVTTGWGLLGGSSSKPRLLASGTIRLTAKAPFAERLHRLRCDLEELIARLEPTEAAVESPFHGADARAALQLAHARGVILAALGGARIPLTEYSPASVKKAVTGAGGADKSQVQTMVVRLLRLAEAPSSPDESDALAVALCHLSGTGYRDRVTRALGASSRKRVL